MPAENFQLAGQPINRMGFGTMQLPGRGVWGPPADHGTALAVLRRAVELGVDHIDTAQFYGPDVANDLLREALWPYPPQLRIVTKVGARRDENGGWLMALRPEELRVAVEQNLRSLGLEALHLVNLRVVEPHGGREGVPFEESLGAVADMRQEGKIELIGVSNVSLEQLAAARAITDIAGVQNQYSVFDRNSQDVLGACGAMGMAFVPFFPLGSAFGEGPARLASDPLLASVAKRHDATSAQIALAWLLHAADHILLIPGTCSLGHLNENIAASAISLGGEDLAQLEGVSAQPQ